MKYKASKRTGVKNIYLLGILLALVGATIAWKKIEPWAREHNEDWPTSGRAIEVFDGDTFKLANGMIVRLLGVDAEPGSTAAKEELGKLILGKKLTLKYGTKAEDDFGRLSAWVWVEDRLVQQELVDKKLVINNMGNFSLKPKQAGDTQIKN